MSKKIRLFLIGALATALVYSCKHEVPEAPAPAGNGGVTVPPSPCAPDTVYFQQQVLPILVSNCALGGCHDAVSRKEGLDITSYVTLMASGHVRAGRPWDSELYEKITESDHDDRMPPPPRNPLTREQQEAVRKWIAQGARNNSCSQASCSPGPVTYSAAIQPIISNSCAGCHSGTAPSGGISLVTHAGLKAKAEDGRLWGAVNHLSGFSAMPKNGNKLSSCELQQIRQWIDAGAPNN